MKIAITGGTGFVGRHLAARLAAAGHEVVVVSRGDPVKEALLTPGVTVVAADITDSVALASAFSGCAAVAHCAGINREIGAQTYATVHVRGTETVIAASRAAGVTRLAMLSFLRARPDGPTAYHRSKWDAEQLVRQSGLTWTILKAGVIYGRGDHMLDHLSHAFHTFPIFGLVGLKEQPVRPVAVADVARVLEAVVTGDARLGNRTLAVLGPEEMPLGVAVRRVARVTGRRPFFVRLPIAAHVVISRVAEQVMRVPLVSIAQVRILQEGVTVPAPAADALPPDIAPTTRFSESAIRAGLPPAGGFGRSDLRWCARTTAEGSVSRSS